MKSIPILAFSLIAIAAARAAEPATFEVAGKTFTVAEGWEVEKTRSPMRKAQFKAGAAEVVVFFFGKGQGGGAEANVARWLGQFKEAKDKLAASSKTEEVKGGKVTTVTAGGTYMSGPPFGDKVPMEGYALRGAIVEFDGGPVFIKMTGPAKDVKAAAEAFDKTVRSGLAE